MFDLDFFNKNYNRYIYLLKYSTSRFNYTDILELQKIIYQFNIKEITEINHQTVLSCIFFYKYYFGVVPFFKNYKHAFKLNIHYFSFSLEYVFWNNTMYSALIFLINDIYYMINKIYLSSNKFKNYWEYTVNDMNFFIEKKNTLGFFNLKHKLIIQLYVSKKHKWDFDLLNNFKLKHEQKELFKI